MTVLWEALALGAIYTLVASSFNLVLLASGTLNFAQGALVMVGTYLGYAVVQQWHWPPAIAIIISIAVGVCLGVVAHLLCIWPLSWGQRRRQGATQSELITTVAFATILVGLVVLIWGVDPVSVSYLGVNNTAQVFGGVISRLQVVVIAAGIILPVCLHMMFHHTRRGLECIAASEDPVAARVRGINTFKLAVFGYGAAGALATFVGALIVPITFAYSDIGNILAVSGFVAVAIGGAGRQVGGMVGGFGVGLASELASRYLGSDYANIAILAVLLLTLLVKPTGVESAAKLRIV